MSEPKSNSKQLTFGERLINYGKAAGLFAAAGVAVYGAFLKGEPQAEDLWVQLQKKVKEQNHIINEQSAMVEKLARRIVHIQGIQEGFNAGKLFAQVEELKDRLKRGKRPLAKLSKPVISKKPPPAPVQRTLPKATPLKKGAK